MDYASIIEKNKARMAELEELMGRPNFYDDNRRAGELLREHRGLQTLAKAWAPRSARAAGAIRAALIVCADHELNVSAFTARCIASAATLTRRSPLCESVGKIATPMLHVSATA